MREDVLEAVRQLKSIHIPEAVLDHAIHHQLREPQDLARQVEGVAEARPASTATRRRSCGRDDAVVPKFKLRNRAESVTFSAPSSSAS